MTISSSEIMSVAESTGFRAEMVEKVLHLLNLLDAFNSHPFLKGKWVLKGGTALNMFVLDLPRLSVDIYLNFIGDVEFDTVELARQLIPTLRRGAIQGAEDAGNYGKTLVEECRQALSAVLPFNDAEREFLDLLLDKGEIDPSILTTDKTLRERIRRQPLLEWKALNVRKFKGLI